MDVVRFMDKQEARTYFPTLDYDTLRSRPLMNNPECGHPFALAIAEEFQTLARRMSDAELDEIEKEHRETKNPALSESVVFFTASYLMIFVNLERVRRGFGKEIAPEENLRSTVRVAFPAPPPSLKPR